MEERRKNILALLLCASALLILPLVSGIAAGKQPGRYLVFPPPVSSAHYAYFPLAIGAGLAIGILSICALVFFAFQRNDNKLHFSMHRVPLWSVAGMAL